MDMARSWAASALDCTVPRLFSRNVREFPNHPALTDSGRTWTWAQADTEVSRVAAGLIVLGLRPGQTMLITMGSRAEHWLADLAATHVGAVPSTVHAEHTGDEVLFAAQHSRAQVAVLEGADQIRRWSLALRHATTLHRVVVLDDSAIPPEDSRFLSWRSLVHRGEQRLHDDPDLVRRHGQAITPDRPAALLYTSASSQPSKGVVLTHRNIGYATAAWHQVTRIPPHATGICYRPLSNITERMSGIYRAVHDATHVHFCHDMTRIATALPQVRPHLFLGSPAAWEKLAAKLIGFPAEQRAVPQVQYRLAVRLGLDRTIWAASTSCLDPGVLDLFASIGVDIHRAWGPPETTGCATANHARAQRLGTAGRGLPGVEVRTAEDGTVQVRGPNVCAGYLQPDGMILPVTDAEGWLSTGDIGRLDKDRFLTIEPLSED